MKGSKKGGKGRNERGETQNERSVSAPEKRERERGGRGNAIAIWSLLFDGSSFLSISLFRCYNRMLQSQHRKREAALPTNSEDHSPTTREPGISNQRGDKSKR